MTTELTTDFLPNITSFTHFHAHKYLLIGAIAWRIGMVHGLHWGWAVKEFKRLDGSHLHTPGAYSERTYT